MLHGQSERGCAYHRDPPDTHGSWLLLPQRLPVSLVRGSYGGRLVSAVHLPGHPYLLWNLSFHFQHHRYVQVGSLLLPRLSAATYSYVDQTISSPAFDQNVGLCASSRLAVLPCGIVVAPSLSSVGYPLNVSDVSELPILRLLSLLKAWFRIVRSGFPLSSHSFNRGVTPKSS